MTNHVQRCARQVQKPSPTSTPLTDVQRCVVGATPAGSGTDMAQPASPVIEAMGGRVASSNSQVPSMPTVFPFSLRSWAGVGYTPTQVFWITEQLACTTHQGAEGKTARPTGYGWVRNAPAIGDKGGIYVKTLA